MIDGITILTETSKWEQYIEETPLYPKYSEYKNSTYTVYRSRYNYKIIYEYIIYNNYPGLEDLQYIKKGYKYLENELVSDNKRNKIINKLFANVKMVNIL